MFDFTIHNHDAKSFARTGSFSTPHGVFQTPAFMPCGTKATVKTMTPEELKSLGCEILLANTYHLMLRPGGELVEKMGGLHRWMNWDRPILTDSGGYQVFSLSTMRKVSDDGVAFQSHIDGATHFVTPEKATAVQEQLGADLIMAFDECAPHDADELYAKKAMERTHRWLERCMRAKRRSDQALLPIVQGGTFLNLRKESAKFATQHDARAFAIGGVAVGEEKEKIREVVETIAPLLPKNKPRYLMGVGEPKDIINAVANGIDMFDCVLPTRLARHGNFWNCEGKRTSILRAEYKAVESPLDGTCACYTCTRFSISYLRHLMVEKEMLGSRLLTFHNLHFIFELMRRIRSEIAAGTFHQLYATIKP